MTSWLQCFNEYPQTSVQVVHTVLTVANVLLLHAAEVTFVILTAGRVFMSVMVALSLFSATNRSVSSSMIPVGTIFCLGEDKVSVLVYLYLSNNDICIHIHCRNKHAYIK